MKKEFDQNRFQNLLEICLYVDVVYIDRNFVTSRKI